MGCGGSEEEHHDVEVHCAEPAPQPAPPPPVPPKEYDHSVVPEGCTDFHVVDGKLVASDKPEDWRIAGHTKVEYGFELTQDADDQEGHLLCRVPFEVEEGKSEIHASLVYMMEPKTFAEDGGQGLCVYLCDPSIEGWDREFNGTGPLGFVGKHGAILGVGVDCTGTFCEGQPASVAVKRGIDGKLLCEPCHICKTEDGEGVDGVRTDEGEWREVKVKFDIEDMTVDVKIAGHKYLDNVPIDLGDGVKLPRTVCVGVCAGTAAGKNNHICVNKLKLKSED